MWGDEGGPVTYTVHAIGTHEAREIGGWRADRDGYTDHSVTGIEHGLNDEDEPPDGIDQWKAYRDAGYSEPQLRMLAGDR